MTMIFGRVVALLVAATFVRSEIGLIVAANPP
jgi:hypothetical protein